MQEPRPEHGTLSMSNSAKCHSAMFCEVVTDDTVQAGSRRNHLSWYLRCRSCNREERGRDATS